MGLLLRRIQLSLKTGNSSYTFFLVYLWYYKLKVTNLFFNSIQKLNFQILVIRFSLVNKIGHAHTNIYRFQKVYHPLI